MEEIEVDLYEAEKQRREEVLESGKYMLVEVIIPRFNLFDGNIPNPIVKVDCADGNSSTLAFASMVLEHTAKDILKGYERAEFLKELMNKFGYRASTQTVSKGDRMKIEKEKRND